MRNSKYMETNFMCRIIRDTAAFIFFIFLLFYSSFSVAQTEFENEWPSHCYGGDCHDRHDCHKCDDKCDKCNIFNVACRYDEDEHIYVRISQKSYFIEPSGIIKPICSKCVKECLQKIIPICNSPQDLYRAIYTENIKRIDKCLQNGIDLNGRLEECTTNYTDGRLNKSMTPLACAVYKKKLVSFKELLKRGADPDMRNNKGETALMIGIYHCSPDIALNVTKELIANGADLEIRSEIFMNSETSITSHATALLYAMNKLVFGSIRALQKISSAADGSTLRSCKDIAAANPEHTESLNIIKELIVSGANLDVQIKGGYTALMDAVLSCEPYSIKELIDGGADLDIQNENGRTALIVGIMRIGGRFNSENPPTTPFITEVLYIDIIKDLIDGGANRDIQDINGQTALMRAVIGNYTDIAEVLLSSSTDPLIIEGEFNGAPISTPLYLGGRYVFGGKEMADPDIQSKSGRTALMYAVNHNSMNSIKILIEVGAKTYLQDTDGNTVLMFAIIFHKKDPYVVDMIRELLADGGNHINYDYDMNDVGLDLDADTILKMELKQLSVNVELDADIIREFVREFVDYGKRLMADIGSDMSYEKNEKAREDIYFMEEELRYLEEEKEFLIDKGLNDELRSLNERIREKRRDFYHNVYNVYGRYIRLGIYDNHTINIQNKDGHTALMLAILDSEFLNVIKALTTNEYIDLDIQDKDGYTALMLAAKKKKPEVIKHLLDKGANKYIMNFITGDGETALDIARNTDCKVCIELLEDHSLKEKLEGKDKETCTAPKTPSPKSKGEKDFLNAVRDQNLPKNIFRPTGEACDIGYHIFDELGIDPKNYNLEAAKKIYERLLEEDPRYLSLKKDGWKFFDIWPNDSGYFGIALVKEVEGNRLVTIVSKGMTFSQPSEYYKNYEDGTKILSGSIPGEYIELERFIKHIESRVGSNDKIVLAGHSKGGFLSKVASAVLNLPAISFDAPGAKKAIQRILKEKYFIQLLAELSALPSGISSYSQERIEFIQKQAEQKMHDYDKEKIIDIVAPINMINNLGERVNDPVFIYASFDEYSHGIDNILKGITTEGELVKPLFTTDVHNIGKDVYYISKNDYELHREVYDKDIKQRWDFFVNTNDPSYDVEPTVTVGFNDFRKKYPTFESYREHIVSKLPNPDNND